MRWSRESARPLVALAVADNRVEIVERAPRRPGEGDPCQATLIRDREEHERTRQSGPGESPADQHAAGDKSAVRADRHHAIRVALSEQTRHRFLIAEAEHLDRARYPSENNRTDPSRRPSGAELVQKGARLTSRTKE